MSLLPSSDDTADICFSCGGSGYSDREGVCFSCDGTGYLGGA